MDIVRVRITIASVAFCIATMCFVSGRSIAATQWLGITVGEPFADAYTVLGDPRRQDKGRNGTVYSYSLSGNADLKITTYKGRIAEIRLMRANADPKLSDPTIADPKGVQVGSDKAIIDGVWGKATQQSERGGIIRAYYADGDAVWEYEIDDNSGLMIKPGAVIDIAEFLTMNAAKKLSPVALPTMHTGENVDGALLTASIAQALPIKQFEQEYFRDRPCNRTTIPGVPDDQPVYDAKWSIAAVRTVAHAGSKYDVVTARCIGGMTSTPQVFQQQDVYFKD